MQDVEKVTDAVKSPLPSFPSHSREKQLEPLGHHVRAGT
jgi:hypothetical protein